MLSKFQPKFESWGRGTIGYRYAAKILTAQP